MCHIRLFRFLRAMDEKKEEEFLSQFKRYIVTDIITAVLQFVQYGLYGFWPSIVVATWFLVDAIAGIYIVSFDPEKRVGLPQIFLDLNTASNSLCFILFWSVRTYMLIAIKGGLNNNVLSVCIAAFTTPTKIMKLFIVNGYRRFSLENKLRIHRRKLIKSRGGYQRPTGQRTPSEDSTVDITVTYKRSFFPEPPLTPTDATEDTKYPIIPNSLGSNMSVVTKSPDSHK